MTNNSNQPKHTQGQVHYSKLIENKKPVFIIYTTEDLYDSGDKAHECIGITHKEVCRTDSEANAQRIVKAVNMHDEALSLIKELIPFMEYEDEEGHVLAPDSILRHRIRAILKQAELK